ncbi:hypothetical protein PPL_02119 [Heterostelium album PN500]|uniref:Flavin-containing monooxygenase n=1 Tax=Heterostelium pallidum (strain ATCC 26659 / Pp 5 / PN500) TaxID=670386 RepID=D3B1E7_HETP5|nr:hypothetical protein PPL_02119 [Heterostelium album PN500]EFA85121.1 hypothetical protein PPL_02119 [Heterostelium album PN500]|eukprot:XP_020437230.1 hypothetical protein PPL_02119 [Heterostelium album PN500]
MEEVSKSVAIIGGGFSGIFSLKEALENRLSATLFERENAIGGLWNPESGAMWDNMCTNISFVSSMISDYPWTSIPPEREFPTNQQIFKYLSDYANHFKLYENIQCNAKVTKVSRNHQQGGYQVEYINSATGQSISKAFDFVIVATGILKSFLSLATLKEEELAAARRKMFDSICGQLSIPSLFIEPDQPSFLAISDDYCKQVRDGCLIFKKAKVVEMTKDSLILDDGSLERVDDVILCQGYTVDLSFLEQEIKDAIQYIESDTIQPIIAHKEVFCPSMPGIAFIGIYKSADTTVMELQARWATKVFSGAIKPPTDEEMRKDSIAAAVQAMPDLKSLSTSNPSLYKMLYSNVNTPLIYRLSTNNTQHNDRAIQIIEEIDKLYYHQPNKSNL